MRGSSPRMTERRFYAAASSSWLSAARRRRRCFGRLRRAPQQMPVMGYLGALSPSWDEQRLSALRQSLAEAGYVEGKTVAIEYHWVEGDYDRLAGHAAEFVRRRVAVIFAGSLPSALAAKSATATIPIVFVMGADPVKLGVVASLNQPAGNVTGIMQLYGALGGKRLELTPVTLPPGGGNEAELHGIGTDREHNRYARGRGLGGERGGRRATRGDHRDPPGDQVGRERRQPVELIVRPAASSPR